MLQLGCMEGVKERILQQIKDALLGLNIDFSTVTVDFTSDLSHGDYTTNIALVVSKQVKVPPRELAEKIVNKIVDNSKTKDLIDKIEVAEPGFINFWIKKDVLTAQVKNLANNISTAKFLSRHKIMVEFTDPNPFKEFHIGHLYSNIVGESISRLLEVSGAEIKRVNYQGDVGLHVAKSLWGMMQKIKEEHKTIEELSQMPLEARVRFLGESYALGSSKYEEKAIKEEINDINKKVYEKSPDVLSFYELGRRWTLDYFELIYKRLDTKFWHYYFESEVGGLGIGLVKEYLGKGVFEESKGAVIFPGEKYGLHNRVFINSLGLPTYEAKELGLAEQKARDYDFDTSIVITGNEIDDYFKVILKALEIINPELKAKIKHISHGMVRLPEGKMSSRTGKVILGEWLLNEAVVTAKTKMQEVLSMDINGEITDKVSEIVGVGAVKYALLKNSIGGDINFRFEESISFEGNSAPYLQYTYARAQSVLRKASKASLEISSSNFNIEEYALIRFMSRFTEIIEKAARNYAPHLIATYAFELAQQFNGFYQKHPILKAEDPEKNLRLAIVKATGNIIKESLYLLGIEVTDQM